MNKLKYSASIFAAILLTLTCINSFAASVQGYWKTIDDKTGQPKSIVKISGSSGNLTGYVTKLYPGALEICSACKGRLQGKPIKGMAVLWGFKQDSSNPNYWYGGTIMDPKTGKYYSSNLTVSDDNRTLSVRGYVGVPMFGRSQTWIRVK